MKPRLPHPKKALEVRRGYKMKSRVFQTTESEAPCIIDRLSISLALNLPLFSKLQKAKEEEADGGGAGEASNFLF